MSPNGFTNLQMFEMGGFESALLRSGIKHPILKLKDVPKDKRRLIIGGYVSLCKIVNENQHHGSPAIKFVLLKNDNSLNARVLRYNNVDYIVINSGIFQIWDIFI